jgi:hypothetical protein
MPARPSSNLMYWTWLLAALFGAGVAGYSFYEKLRDRTLRRGDERLRRLDLAALGGEISEIVRRWRWDELPEGARITELESEQPDVWIERLEDLIQALAAAKRLSLPGFELYESGLVERLFELRRRAGRRRARRVAPYRRSGR